MLSQLVPRRHKGKSEVLGFVKVKEKQTYKQTLLILVFARRRGKLSLSKYHQGSCPFLDLDEKIALMPPRKVRPRSPLVNLKSYHKSASHSTLLSQIWYSY